MRIDVFMNEIKFSDAAVMPGEKIPVVQILRVTKFKHPVHGDIEITADTLKQFKENFDNRVRRQDIAIDYSHENEKIAAGWLKEVYFNDDSCTELWGKVDWTKNGLQKLNEREFRYFSPEFAFQWTDPETGVAYKNVLFGGGLTNRPQVKDMAPIVLNETDGGKMDEKLKELEGQVAKLTEELGEAKGEVQKYMDMMPPMQQGMQDKDALIAELQAKIKELENQLAAQAAEKMKMCKEQEFATLLSEGKVCAAQKDAYVAGDMAEFVKNAQAVNLSEAGEGAGAPVDNQNAQDKVIALAEALVQKEKINMGAAISRVLKDNKDLAKELSK